MSDLPLVEAALKLLDGGALAPQLPVHRRTHPALERTDAVRAEHAVPLHTQDLLQRGDDTRPVRVRIPIPARGQARVGRTPHHRLRGDDAVPRRAQHLLQEERGVRAPEPVYLRLVASHQLYRSQRADRVDTGCRASADLVAVA